MTEERTAYLAVDRMTAELFRQMFGAARLNVLTWNAYRDLLEEMGSDAEVIRFLVSEATTHNKPVAINVPKPSRDGGSITTMIGPEGWSEERLQGWLGNAGPALEGMFGRATWMGKTPRRNDPCYCGSGLKFKRCCGE
jgi:uncharacterized protein YecA (UPF0149 family)